jgi:hypothetical protein
MSTGTCQRLWSSRSGDSWSREYPGQWEVTDRSIKISPRGSEVTEIAMIGAPGSPTRRPSGGKVDADPRRGCLSARSFATHARPHESGGAPDRGPQDRHDILSPQLASRDLERSKRQTTRSPLAPCGLTAKKTISTSGFGLLVFGSLIEQRTYEHPKVLWPLWRRPPT